MLGLGASPRDESMAHVCLTVLDALQTLITHENMQPSAPEYIDSSVGSVLVKQSVRGLLLRRLQEAQDLVAVWPK